ncbi:MAG: hypothetical protein ABJ382_10015 [Ilumatobacter sp.]
MSNLAYQVKAALEAEAERAPEAPPWSPTRRTQVMANESSSRSGWIYATGVAATAASVIGLLVLAVRDAPPVDDPATASNPVASAWIPSGEQFRLDDLGPVESLEGESVTLSALSRRIGVEDHPALSIYTSIGYTGEASIVEWRCLESDGGGGGCASVDLPGPDIGVTSSIDNGIAGFDLWTWSNVPVDAAYVVYDDGDDARWQTPVFGVAAFPNVDGFESVAVAYNNEGVEVGRVDPVVLEAAQQPDPNSRPLTADLEQSQGAEVQELMNQTAIDCLTRHGATFGTESVGQLPGGDTNASWDECVSEAGTAVEEWPTANGISFFDPVTDSPEADEPYIKFGD